MTQLISKQTSGRRADAAWGELRSLWEPPPDLTVSEWAEAYRYLSPESSAEHGKWHNARAPHLIEPMDAMSPREMWETVVMMFASQTGKTEVINNVVGYVMSYDPGPALIVQPNIKPMAEAWSKDRLEPMIRDTPELAGISMEVAAQDQAGPGRKRQNTVLHKRFPGGHLTAGGANSPAGLASRPIRYLLADEIDRYELTKEGDAIALARKRTTTFYNRKILLVSSPTYENVGIHAAYYGTDVQRQRAFVCLGCAVPWFPQHKHFDYDAHNPGNRDIKLVCPNCGHIHEERSEYKLKAAGVWITRTRQDGTVADNGRRKSVGYWMNQWASTFASWEDTINEFLAAKDDKGKLQTVTNTAFAEPFHEFGDTVEPDALAARREPYILVPEGVLVLVAGIDVQGDRFEMEVVGYGLGEESWGISYRVIWGDPAKPETWEALDEALLARYAVEDGRELGIAAAGIDTGGHYTRESYLFCSRRFHRRVYALKGLNSHNDPLVSPGSKRKIGAGPDTVRLFGVGVDQGKRLVYNRLNLKMPGPGYCHFPQTYDEQYFEGLTAEELRLTYKKGAPVYYWFQTRKRNEPLDIRVYAAAALKLLNPVWSVLAGKVGLTHTTENSPRPAPTPELDGEVRAASNAATTAAPSRPAPKPTRQRTTRRQPRGFASRWR